MKSSKLEQDWVELRPKNCSDNPLQNIWHKVKKSSKLEQDFKNLLLHFACFFPAIVKV